MPCPTDNDEDVFVVLSRIHGVSLEVRTLYCAALFDMMTSTYLMGTIVCMQSKSCNHFPPSAVDGRPCL